MPVTLDERITVADNLEPVSWGVLSTADIGLAKVIPAMQASSLARVDAIASRSPERAARAAAGAGIARSYESYQELLGDPEPRPLRVEQLSEEDRNSRGDDLLLRAFELQRTEALRRARGNRPSEGRDWGELFDEAAKQSNLAGEEGG